MKKSPANLRHLITHSDRICRDEFLVENARRFIKHHYKKNQHHVACTLLCGEKIYHSLHLDNHGFDICAEPIAISNAILAQEENLDKIVSVFWNGNSFDTPRVVAPCGNCRQILLEYAPNIDVILENSDGQFISEKARNLIPYPYIK